MDNFEIFFVATNFSVAFFVYYSLDFILYCLERRTLDGIMALVGFEACPAWVKSLNQKSLLS
jgi:hypothetical protein